MQLESLFNANRELLDAIARFEPAEREDIMEALIMAIRWHGDQQRKSGTPYVIHPMEVAGATARFGGDATSVCAALLHDVLEDTGVSDEQMEERFGAEIYGLVSAVTKREGTPNGQFLADVLAYATKDPRVGTMKLADAWANNRGECQLIFSPEKHLAHLKDLEEFYIPKLSAVPGVSETAATHIRQAALESRAAYEAR